MFLLLLLHACITFNQLFHQLEEDGIAEVEDEKTIKALGCLLKNVANGNIKVDQEDWKTALIEIERLLRGFFKGKLGPNGTVDDQKDRMLVSQARSLLENCMRDKPIRKQTWSDALDHHCMLSESNALHKVVLLLRRLGYFSPDAFGLDGLLIDPATEIQGNTIFGACFKKSGITGLPVEEASGDEEDAAKSSTVTFAPGVGTPVIGIADSQMEVSPVTVPTGLSEVR